MKLKIEVFLVSSQLYHSSDAGTGGQGDHWPGPPIFGADQLTLFQPGESRLSPPITTGITEYFKILCNFASGILSYEAQNSTTEMTLHYWWKTAGFYTLSLNLSLVSMDFHQEIKFYNMQHKEALEIKIQLHMSQVIWKSQFIIFALTFVKFFIEIGISTSLS